MIEVNTRFGSRPARYHETRHESGSKTLVVLFPGRGYNLDAPLLWYARQAAFAAGYDVIGVEYGYLANRVAFNFDQLDWLINEASDALEGIVSAGAYEKILFLGKSIGTVVQAEVAKHALYRIDGHVFLTPIRPALSAIQTVDRGLVVVGGDDPAFGPTDVAALDGLAQVEVHVLPGADHGLEIADPLGSITLLHETVSWCRGFFESSSK